MHDHSVHVQCGECPIRHRAVCARCDTDELGRLEQIKYYRSFQAGQTIIWSGDRMEFVGSVVIGHRHADPDDGGRSPADGRAPAAVGFRRVVRVAPTAAFDVTATTDLVMCCFRKKPFEELMATTPHIAQRLLEMTLDELDAAREWMLLLGRKTAREKIASLISIIARRDAALHLRRGIGRPVGRSAADPRRDGRLPGPDAGNRQPPDQRAEEGRRDQPGRQPPRHRSPIWTAFWKRPATTATAGCWSDCPRWSAVSFPLKSTLCPWAFTVRQPHFEGCNADASTPATSSPTALSRAIRWPSSWGRTI